MQRARSLVQDTARTKGREAYVHVSTLMRVARASRRRRPIKIAAARRLAAYGRFLGMNVLRFLFQSFHCLDVGNGTVTDACNAHFAQPLIGRDVLHHHHVDR
jgi:hypothetical protein